MTGKLLSKKRYNRDRSVSRDSSCSDDGDRRYSRKYTKSSRYRYDTRDRSRDRYRRSYSRSRSSSSSSSSSDRGGRGGSKKKPLRTKYDDLMDKVKVKEEPVSDEDGDRRKTKSRSTNVKSRYSDEEAGGDRYKNSRSTERDDTWKNRRVKKERWGGGGDDKEHEWGKKSDRLDGSSHNKKPLVDKAKPDFGLSGKLTEDTNTFNGVVIKYSEPPEARKPKRRWRLYPFKGDECLKTLHIHRQSAFLIGRDRKVADIPVDHPSCSKQHAALQYRLVTYNREDGRAGKRICPYIIDLESANGTFVNNKKIEAKKYVELLERDVIKFGFSSREYVLLHEHSKDSEDDDNVFDNSD
ncbi:smad nuclear-interacting protein 1 isoform X4 [Nilaparvata lugens]|uniref:smad nuclear-interacting protein 1 isoform X3 n=1 Tax=Nilaparvata lugens TaxID=108931 RepID=UPI00193D669D|nr:smad nuclear-interacting protein 1 isoform X3 [Nilaparvata lugens]XP_039289272.1 smad nuclear-interacting protein 1 isoform X4 [Nilaparvata lugens]